MIEEVRLLLILYEDLKILQGMIFLLMLSFQLSAHRSRTDRVTGILTKEYLLKRFFNEFADV